MAKLRDAKVGDLVLCSTQNTTGDILYIHEAKQFPLLAAHVLERPTSVINDYMTIGWKQGEATVNIANYKARMIDHAPLA